MFELISRYKFRVGAVTSRRIIYSNSTQWIAIAPAVATRMPAEPEIINAKALSADTLLITWRHRSIDNQTQALAFDIFFRVANDSTNGYRLVYTNLFAINL